MKKVINITLGSIVFAIEQDAYDALALYLEGIKNNLSLSDDANEIISDIESAIAEKFIARKRGEKNAVTVVDVDAVIAEMGSPTDFGEGADEGATQAEATTTKEGVDSKKRLYRDSEDAVVAGVAAGIANYFNIDPVIVRLIFVVSVFFNGLGVLVYLIFWLIVPAAKTTAEKYAMRGESVTVEQITERVKKKLDAVDTDALKNSARNTWGGMRPVFVKLFDVLGTLVRSLGTVFRYIIGVAFLIGGAVSLAALVSTYSIVLLSDKTFIPADAQTALDIMLGSSLGIVAISSSFVMVGIPFLLLVMLGGSLIAKRNLFTATKSIALAVVWIVAVVLAGTSSILQVEKVMQELDPEGYSNGQYQVHVNTANDWAEFEADFRPIEEGAPGAPPTDTPLELPEGDWVEGSLPDIEVSD